MITSPAASVGSAMFLIICGYLGTTTVTAVLFLTLGVGMGGLGLAGFAINHLDIAPKYAGVLMGITNTAATLPGIVGPQLAKAIAVIVSVCNLYLIPCVYVGSRKDHSLLDFFGMLKLSEMHSPCPVPVSWLYIPAIYSQKYLQSKDAWPAT